MKVLLITLAVLMSTAAFGESAACTTLYNHGDRNIVLCHAGDSFTKTDVRNGNASLTTITEKTYREMMTADTLDQAAHTAQLKAVQEQAAKDEARIEARRKALAIHKKKDCVKAGYAWKSGVCEAQ